MAQARAICIQQPESHKMIFKSQSSDSQCLRPPPTYGLRSTQSVKRNRKIGWTACSRQSRNAMSKLSSTATRGGLSQTRRGTGTICVRDAAGHIRRHYQPQMRWLLLLCIACLMTPAHSFSRTVVNLSMSDSNLSPKPLRICSSAESQPKQKWTRSDRKTNMRLEGRILRLENLVYELCGALVYSDDMSLLEREMLSAGTIYQDPTTEKSRQPVLMRREIADIAWRYGRPVSPPARKWH